MITSDKERNSELLTFAENVKRYGAHYFSHLAYANIMAKVVRLVERFTEDDFLIQSLRASNEALLKEVARVSLEGREEVLALRKRYVDYGPDVCGDITITSRNINDFGCTHRCDREVQHRGPHLSFRTLRAWESK